jgi:hypothetical protein
MWPDSSLMTCGVIVVGADGAKSAEQSVDDLAALFLASMPDSFDRGNGAAGMFDLNENGTYRSLDTVILCHRMMSKRPMDTSDLMFDSTLNVIHGAGAFARDGTI